MFVINCVMCAYHLFSLGAHSSIMDLSLYTVLDAQPYVENRSGQSMSSGNKLFVSKNGMNGEISEFSVTS